MQFNTVAKRYAKALFDLVRAESKGDPSLSKTTELLKAISDSIQSNPSLRNVLFNPSFGIDEKKKTLNGLVDGLAEGGSQTLPGYLKSFLSLLVKKSRLVHLPDIVREVEELQFALAKTTPVYLAVPVGLSEAQKADFTRTFENILNRKIQLTIKVSPELLGGMTIQIGSKVFDASLRMKLNSLRSRLMA